MTETEMEWCIHKPRNVKDYQHHQKLRERHRTEFPLEYSEREGMALTTPRF